MYDILIIGGGAAGMTAAITSAKNRFKTLLLDKGPEAGYMSSLANISDFPGCAEGVSGAELIERMKKQAMSLGAEIKNTSVRSCDFSQPVKRVTTSEPATYEAKAIILTTGNMPHQDNHLYPGEKELHGRGVSHDVATDAASTKHSSVAIIGKSNSVAESVLMLSNYADKVHWIIPASKLDLPQEIKDELEKRKNVEPYFSTSLKSVNGSNQVVSVSILTAGQEKSITVKYVFLPSQQFKPATDFLNGTGVQTGPDGVVMVTEHMETSISGVYAAGNILSNRPQMHVVCAAQGSIAAMNAGKCLGA